MLLTILNALKSECTVDSVAAILSSVLGFIKAIDPSLMKDLASRDAVIDEVVNTLQKLKSTISQ